MNAYFFHIFNNLISNQFYYCYRWNDYELTLLGFLLLMNFYQYIKLVN